MTHPPVLRGAADPAASDNGCRRANRSVQALAASLSSDAPNPSRRIAARAQTTAPGTFFGLHRAPPAAGNGKAATHGRVAQSEEHAVVNREVAGSIPAPSANTRGGAAKQRGETADVRCRAAAIFIKGAA